jgi:transposase, IS30 family
MKKSKKRKKFCHLSDKKRDRLEALLNSGSEQKDIAKILKVHPSTICREIKKRKKVNGVYDAEVAEHKAGVKRSNSKYAGMKIEKYPELKKRIKKELKACRSPDEIAGMLKDEKVKPRIGTNAIYKWLYSSRGQKYCRYLCTERYHKKKHKISIKRTMIPNRVSIDKRKKTRGIIHAEGDTLVSGQKTHSKAAASMVAIQKTKLMLGDRLDNMKPENMKASMLGVQKEARIDTLTMDNGIENKDHEEFGLATYFCDSHAPWQKPLVEQSIGLLRRWYIKKGTDLATVSPKRYKDMLHYFNHKKRKSLGYKSAYEMSYKHGIIKTLPSDLIAFHPRI